VAVNQKNFQWYTYVDDSGQSWNMRGESGGPFEAVNGHAAFDGANPTFGRTSKRRHPRYVIATNPTTFRSVKGIVYTAAAFAAIAGGDAIAVSVPGSASTETFNVSAKVAERMPLPSAGRHLADA
jgi:hypothetical protein